MQQPYLFIGGNHDGLNYPAASTAPERLQMQVGVAEQETYNRSTLSVGDVSIVAYIHESLTPEQALNLLVEYYKVWAVNMPGGRR
jgi:hypothetical protein